MRSLAHTTGALVLAITAWPAAAQSDPPSISLQEAVARFHRTSPALELARSRLSAETAGSRQGRAAPNPVASFSHEDLGAYSERYLTLTQRVDFLWETSARGRRAEARIDMARATFRADSARLLREAKDAWVAAWAHRAAVAVLERADAAVAGLLASAEARFSEGDLAGYDVRRLRVERARVGRRLAQARVEALLAEERLATRVGAEGVRRLAAPDVLPEVPDLGPLGDVVARALVRRPELLAARSATAAYDAEASLARASMLTGTSLGAGLKSQSDGRDGLYLEVRVPVPLLDRRAGATEAARSSASAAGAELTAIERMVALEASLAWARMEAAERSAALVGADGRAEAEALLGIARIAYDEGEIGIVEVLDAVEAYAEAGILDLEVRAESWRAYVELEQAVGGFAEEGRER